MGWKNMLFHWLKIYYHRNDFCHVQKGRLEPLGRCEREVLSDSCLPSKNVSLWLMAFLALEQARSAEAP